MSKVFSVFEFTSLIRTTLESEELFQNVLVSGEMSNFRGPHGSGHLYFTLKDDRATIRCVMWRSRAAGLRFAPQNGMKLIVRGSLGVYEKDGSYQLHATSLEPDGLGSLYLAYEQLKARLQEEGLFDPARKRALPPYPDKVAVVTSGTGAALRDVVTVLGRRFPRAAVLVVPVIVQGDQAPGSIIAGIRAVSERDDVDVVIVGRGGGSIEELWGFNDEGVARAIAACRHPVISAVGHETDFTIADFVADLRAPTPSAAAELAVPDGQAMLGVLRQQGIAMTSRIERLIRDRYQQLDSLGNRLASASPAGRLKAWEENLGRADKRLEDGMSRFLQEKTSKLSVKAAALSALSPLAVLGRGYSVTRKGQRVVTSVADVNEGDEILTMLREGNLISRVTGKEERQ